MKHAIAPSQCFQLKWVKFLVTIACAIGQTTIHSSATLAQILPDNTLPVNSTVTNHGNRFEMIDGTQAGRNLFHSFEQFSLPTGSEAFFNNPLTVENIITRITGGQRSEIDGLIRANGNANLFLINPSGLVFGPNASLNIGGSFLGTSADSITFPDSTEFSAINPNRSSLLSVNVPIGLQMGTNPGEIQVQGAGHNLRLDPQTLIPITGDRPVGFQVLEGQTLALIGGDIRIVGGNLTATEGRIELGSLSSGPANMTLNNSRLEFNYDRDSTFGNITLDRAASVSVNGNGNGSIQIIASHVRMDNSSAVFADTEGTEPGGIVTVNASELVELRGSSSPGNFPTIIFANTLGDAPAGTLNIFTKQLIVRDQAWVSTDTLGAGNGGELRAIASEKIELIGLNSNEALPTGLFVSATSNATGTAGNLTVETAQLTMDNGATISAATFGAGNGGNITIDTANLTMNNRSQVLAATFSSGTGGNVTIKSQDLMMSNIAFISAQTSSIGNGGNVTIESDRIVMNTGAQAVAVTFSSGNAGSLTVMSHEIDLVGQNQMFPSGFLSSAIDLTENGTGTGSGGNVTIETDRLRIRDRATINARHFPSRDRLLRQGTAGSIQIDANSILLENQGHITAAAAAGDRGNITLNSSDLQLRRGSTISTEATGPATGGNIAIDTDNLVALENSDINANAEQSFGGQVIVNAESIFGTEFREQNTPDSDITATSARGVEFNGVVDIKTPDLDPLSGLLDLPENLVDAASLLGTDFCAQLSQESEFIMTGSGGMVPSPTEPLIDEAVLFDWWDVVPAPINPEATRNSEDRADIEQIQPETIDRPPIEAQGWIVKPNGRIVLTSTPHAVTLHTVTPTFGLTSLNCVRRSVKRTNNY